MAVAIRSDVTVYSSVTEENGVEAGPSVTIWTGSSSGNQPGDLQLMTGAILLLMTGGSLLLV